MKCEIIRDLLPSYVDGLTSEESNREITAHVAECAPCKEILEQMQEEVQEKAPKEKRKINPFRKFNRRMRRAVAMAVVICIGVGGFGYKAFARGFAINPQEITMEPKLEGDMLYLNFSVEKGGLTNVGSFYDSEVASISLRNVWQLPAEEQASKEYCWGMNYFLEHTDSKVVFPMHCFEHYKINHHYLNCEDGRRWKNIVRDITGAGQVFEI